MLEGQNSRVLVDALCVRQSVISTSSTQSETLSGATSIKKLTLPSLRTVRAMDHFPFNKEIKISFKWDSEPMIKAVKKGYSRDLEHLSVGQSVSVGWVHEIINILGATVEKIPTNEMPVDVFTKKISDAAKFNHLIYLLGVRTLSRKGQ